MIFSNRSIARFLGDNFECAWQNVRDVPRVEIDFGNGRRLVRTLTGNIATYYCLPDGRIFDLLPGLVSAEEFQQRSRLALLLHGQIARHGAAKQEELVRAYHRTMAALETARPERLKREALSRRMADMSKKLVEGAIERRLVADMLDAHARARSGSSDSTRSRLARDTEYNRKHRYGAVHRMLARRTPARPATITRSLFKEILGVDLQDPYMGLAPNVLGGRVGRR